MFPSVRTDYQCPYAMIRNVGRIKAETEERKNKQNIIVQEIHYSRVEKIQFKLKKLLRASL